MKTLPKSFLNLIQKLQAMPGVGPKSAMRIALELIVNKVDKARALANALNEAIDQLITCPLCFNLCEKEDQICCICKDEERDQHALCVVETVSHLQTFEQTAGYHGRYFVLGGQLSPIDRIGPETLNIPKLLGRIEQENITEIILATASNIEGQTTANYIAQQLNSQTIKISRLATGIPIGTEFEFLNQNTLYQALMERKPWYKT